LRLKPSTASIISLRAIAHVMSRAIDFDREARSRTIEVEHIGPHGMLTANALLTPAQAPP
jgi:hypothetical protein